MKIRPVSPRTRTASSSSSSRAAAVILDGSVRVSPVGLRGAFARPTLALVALVSICIAGQPAQAGTKYWEPTGSTGTNANGTWNTTGVSWTTDSTGASGPNTTFGNSTFTGTYSSGTVSGTYTSTNNGQQVLADDAVFSADPAITGVSTVTLGANLGANSLTFGNPGVTNGGAAAGFTFNSNVLSVGSFTATGANTYTGNTAISLLAGAGPVIFNNQVNLSNGLPDAAGNSTINYSIANNSSSALTFNGLFAANTRPNNTNDTVNLTFSGTGGVTFNGVVTGNTLGASGNPGLSGEGGNLNLIINGGGAVALNAANSAVGVVSLSSGSLTLGNALAMQGLALNQTGGTFSFGTLTTANIAGLTGNTTLTLSNAAGTAGVALNDVGFNPNGTTSAPNPTFSGGINGLGSLTINGVEKSGANTGGTATFSGVLSFTGANGLTINDVPAVGTGGGGGSTVVLTNANTYTGPTTVTLPGGGLTLNGNGSIAGTSAITLNGGGVVPGQTTTVGNTTLVYDNTVNATASRLGTAPITLNGATLNYKAVTTGTNTAGTGSAGAITVGGAATSAFNFANASGTGNTSNFTIASLANTNHGTLSASLPNANNTGTGAVGLVTVTTAPALINGILPWTYETSNGNFLSVNASNQLNAYNNVGTDATAFNNTPASNVQLTAASATPTAAVAENSLIVNFNGTQALGGQTLTLTSGGLVFKTATGVLGSAANDGFLTTAAANPELFVNTAANGTINAAITNNGSTSVALTKFGTSTLTLAGTNTYTGPTTVEQGGLTIATTGSIANSALTLAGGTTLTNAGTAGSVQVNAGATANLTAGSTTGAVTANGFVTYGTSTTAATTTGNFTATGGTGVITYTDAYAAGNTINFGSANNALATITDSAASGPLTVNFAGGANTLTTLTDNTTAAPFNVNTSGTSTLALTTLNIASGATVSFGGDGTGSTTITNQLQTNGTLLKVTAGTVTVSNGRQLSDNLEVDGGSLIFNGNRLSTQGTNQTFTLTGGLVQANANSGYGFRFNGDNGADGAGVAGAKTNATQTGGILLSLNGNSGADVTFNLGSTSATQTSTYALSGGTVAALGTGTNGFVDIGADAAGTSTSTFTLSGSGTLIASQQVQGAQGTGAKQAFVFNGGTLTTPLFVATNLTSTSGTAVSASTNTLINNGGVLAPGFVSPVTANTLVAGTRYTGRTTIMGNYTQNSTGALGINLGGTTTATGFASAATSFDNVLVSGATTLGGRLNVGLNGMFTPTNANTFTVLTSTGALSGTFNNFQVVNPAGTAAANPNTTVAAGGTGAFNVVVTPGTSGTVVLNKFVSGNTYTGNSTAWDAASAASWSVYDPGSSTTLTTPTASGAVAVFGNGDTTAGAATVSLNSTRNVAGIVFSSTNTGATNYTLTNAGSGAIILDNTANNAQATLTDMSAAGNSNIINVPITLTGLGVNALVSNTTTTLSLAGPVSGPTGVAITKTGSGTLALTTAGTISGTTITGGTVTTQSAFSVSTGTLLLGASYSVNAASTMSLGGGMLGVANGVLQGRGATLASGMGSGTSLAGFGALTLTANSSLNFAGTSGTVVFSSYTPGSFSLNVVGSNFAMVGGSSSDGSTDRLIFTTNESANLGSFTFNGMAGASEISLGDGSYEIVPISTVPEPATWAGGVLLVLGGLGAELRRRRLRAVSLRGPEGISSALAS